MGLYVVVEYKDVVESDTPQYGKWAVDGLHRTDTFIHIDSSITPKQLCEKLKSEKFIDSADMRKVGVTDLDKDVIEVRNKRSFKPLCRLEMLLRDS